MFCYEHKTKTHNPVISPAASRDDSVSCGGVGAHDDPVSDHRSACKSAELAGQLRGDVQGRGHQSGGVGQTCGASRQGEGGMGQ